VFILGKPLITPKEIDTKENIILVNNWDDEINLNDVNNMGYPDVNLVTCLL